MIYGLWQNEQQIVTALEKMSSTTVKLKALIKMSAGFPQSRSGSIWSNSGGLRHKYSRLVP